METLLHDSWMIPKTTSAKPESHFSVMEQDRQQIFRNIDKSGDNENRVGFGRIFFA